MKIAVTGANGHVGFNLCSALHDRGYDVRAFTHNNDFAIKHLNIETFRGDILNKDSLIPFLNGVDAVIHLACRISIKGDPGGMVNKINVEGTRNISDVALSAGTRKFIHFSSIHAFQQEPLDKVLDESRPLVGSEAFSYDRSKAEGEKVVMEAIGKGLNALILSPTAIIGPMDYEPSLTGKALIELYNHQVPSLVPGGYNWVDVRDVVQAAIVALDKGRTGEKYLLAGQWRNLKDFSRLIMESTGKKTTQLVLPFWIARIGLPFITLYSKITGGEPLYTSESLSIIMKGNKNISNEKAQSELGFRPRPLEETIKDSLAWFREKGYIN